MTGIIILNYQTWDMSLRCMKSAAKCLKGEPYTIYLVDNASTEPMPEVVKQYIRAHGVTFLQSTVNGGYARGNNIGIRQALEDGCEYLLITNNDILFGKDAVQNMAAYLKLHPDTGIVGPKVLTKTGKVHYSCCSKKTEMKDIFQIFTAAKLIFRRQWKQYYCLDQDPDKGRDVYYVSGCCFMMSAACAREITPLDEHTVLYDEELIIGIRMEESGLKTHYCPDARVQHRHGHTTEKAKPFMFQCICQSEMYYCSNYLHAKKWQLFLLYAYRCALYWIRSLRDAKMREYWSTFRRETRKSYQNSSYSNLKML